MGGKKITLETGHPEAAQAQGWRYGVNISDNSCANNSNTEGPQTLWPLMERRFPMECSKAQGEPFMWQSCLIPSLLKTMWGMGEGNQPYRNSLSWFAIKTAPVQHLWAECTEQSSSKQPRSRFPQQKVSRKTKDFFSSPTLHLAAFHHSCGKDEENPHPLQNKLLGRTQSLITSQVQLPVLRAGFNFITNPPASGVNPTARQERRVESQQLGCLHKRFICKHGN